LLRVKNILLGEAPSLGYGSFRFPSFLFSLPRHDSLILCLFNGVAFKPHMIFSVEFYYFLEMVCGDCMFTEQWFINMDYALGLFVIYKLKLFVLCLRQISVHLLPFNICSHICFIFGFKRVFSLLL